MLPYQLVYSDGYDLNLGRHVFPTEKYRLIHDRLLAEGFASAEDFVEPEPASDDQILLVPGLASLQAALSPAQTNCFYFVARPDGSGGHHFSATMAERARRC